MDRLFDQNPRLILEAIGLKDGLINPLLEANGDKMAITSVVEGKRDIGYLSDPTPATLARINYHGLNLLDAGIDSEGQQKYVFYRGNENGAKKLAELSKKYGGYLSTQTPIEDQILISNLLSYSMDSTLEYFKRTNREPELKALYLKQLHHK